MPVVLFPGGAVGFDEALEFLRLGQGDEVAGDEELVVDPAGGVFDLVWSLSVQSNSPAKARGASGRVEEYKMQIRGRME